MSKVSFDLDELEVDSFETTLTEMAGRQGTVFAQDTSPDCLCTSSATGCGSTMECTCGITRDAGCPGTFNCSCPI